MEEAAAGVEEAAAARAEEKPAAAVEMPAAAASALSNNHVLAWLGGCAELPEDDLLPLLCDDGQSGTDQRARFCKRHEVEDHCEGCGRRTHWRRPFTPTCQKCVFMRKFFGK